MMLIENAGQWHKLWSLRLAIISALLAALEASLPLWSAQLPGGVFASLSTLTGIAAAVARVIKQTDIDGPAE